MTTKKKVDFTFSQWCVIIFVLFPVAMLLMMKDFWRAVRECEVRSTNK